MITQKKICIYFSILIIFIACEPDGEYKDYYKEGNVKLIKNFLDGKLHGKVIRYYENGNVKSIRKYRNGQLEGFSKT